MFYWYKNSVNKILLSDVIVFIWWNYSNFWNYLLLIKNRQVTGLCKLGKSENLYSASSELMGNWDCVLTFEWHAEAHYCSHWANYHKSICSVLPIYSICEIMIIFQSICQFNAYAPILKDSSGMLYLVFLFHNWQHQ